MVRLWLFPTDTPWPWPTPARAANARGGESPTLAEQRSGTERAKRSEGLHKRSAEDCGIPLACARSRAPQEGLVTLLSARRRRRYIRVALRQEQTAGILSRLSSFSFLFRGVERRYFYFQKECSEIMKADELLLSVRGPQPIPHANWGQCE